MESKPPAFPKYEQCGAYHWLQCDRWSAQYNPPLRARYEVLLRRLVKAGRVLDVGCGDGYLMSRAHSPDRCVVGVDAERRAVELARQQLRDHRGTAVAQATCYELPFAARSFDAALLADVIEHLEEPAACLAEIARVVADDGVLLLTTPKWRPDRKWDPLHVREYTPEELRDELEPHFESVVLRFFWPMRWSQWYATKVGWHAVRVFARYTVNPFLRESAAPEEYGQILAVCVSPRRSRVT